MHALVESHAAVLEHNTRLYLDCLQDVDDEVLRRRPSPETNDMAFVACHVLDARYFLAEYLGLEVENPFGEMLAGVRGVEDLKSCPPADALRSAWRDVSARLSSRFGQLDAQDVVRISSHTFPVGDRTVLGGIAFLLAHESYHVGQLAFLRKFHGFGAMRYS